MTQITINVEDKSVLPIIRKILNAFPGVTIAKPEKKQKKSGIEESYEDVRAGRITHCKDVDDMFQKILGI